MKIALVHDFLREYGGAERVVEALHEMWPDAPLYTSFVDWKSLGIHADRFRNWDIRPSWVQHNPVMKKFHSPLRFLARRIWESFDLSDFDVVLSSSGWFICRGVVTKPRSPKNEVRSTETGALHICYIHHPPRNLYGYATGSLYQKYAPVRAYVQVVNFFMRQYDFETAQNVDYFIANSQETARRVEKFYRRDSTVIYPPIEINQNSKVKIQNYNSKVKSSGTYYLSVGRLAWAKRLDVVIEACNRLEVPLKIVGEGKEKESLMRLAGPTIEFVGGVSDVELDRLYAGAKALIFCALDEDFGMVPVEAMAHGVPVIGLSQGGVKETIVDYESAKDKSRATGIFFDAPDAESLTNAIRRFGKIDIDWSKGCFVHAEGFNKERFKKEILAFVETKYREKRK